MLSLFRCENSEVDIPAVERVDFFFPMLASGSDDGANAMSVRGPDCVKTTLNDMILL
jgi:hypothetical protein